MPKVIRHQYDMNNISLTTGNSKEYLQWSRTQHRRKSPFQFDQHVSNVKALRELKSKALNKTATKLAKVETAEELVADDCWKKAHDLRADILLHGCNELVSYGFVFEDGSTIKNINHGCFGSLVQDTTHKMYSNSNSSDPDDYDEDDDSYPLVDLKGKKLNKGKRLKYFVVVPRNIYKGIYYSPPITDLMTNKEVLKYVKWLANESHYASAFLTKSPKDIVMNGAIMTCRLPSRIVVNAAVALRNLSEQAIRAFFWNKIGDLFPDMDKHLVWVMGHMFTTTPSDKDKRYSLLPSGWGGDHSPFYSQSLTPSAIKNLVKGEFQTPNENPFSVDPNYSGMHNLFLPKTERTHDIVWSIAKTKFHIRYPVILKVRTEDAYGRPVMRSSIKPEDLAEVIKEFLKLNKLDHLYNA